MLKLTLAAMAVAISLIFIPAPSQAQEGCKPTKGSCSSMFKTCEQRCQNGNNASACVARICSNSLSTCQATGVWKASAAVACWKTNDRS